MLTGCGGGESAEREQLGHAHDGELGEQLGEQRRMYRRLTDSRY